jgi:hypothetical protein
MQNGPISLSVNPKNGYQSGNAYSSVAGPGKFRLALLSVMGVEVL